MSSIEPGSNNSNLSPSHEGNERVAYLDQALWRQFVDAANPESFASSWLTLQVSMLENVTRGVVVLGQAERGPFVPAAVWPEGDSMPATLSRAAESSMAERRGIVHRPSQKDQSSNRPSHLAYPLLVDEKLYGVVALEFTGFGEVELQSMMRQLQWGCGWLEAYIRRIEQGGSSGGNDRLSRILELTATALEHERFRAAATAVVTELAIQTGCDRVGLGFRDKQHTKIYALSHSAQFGEQTNLARAIASAMDEALDQLTTIVCPGEEDDRFVVQAHNSLAETGGANAICTVLLSNGDTVTGALTFERTDGRHFDSETIELLEHVASLLGPVLEMKRRDDRMLISKIADSFRYQAMKYFGPRHYAAKLVGLTLVALFTFLTVVDGDYRVTADAVLEGSIQRSMVAPINGYINDAKARAGDVVNEGDLLFTIDDRDLRLEFLKWSSQKAQVERRYRDALADRNRSEVNIFKAQLDQAEAHLDLLEEQIARTKVVSPFDGIVVNGDMSQKLGSPVNRGDILLDIAPLDTYRVVLKVDERQISDIKPGQQGHLVLAALPRDQFPFEVEQITPVSEPLDGRNRFRVEAKLKEGIELLRPGMEGTGKVLIDRRSLQWIWTHEMVEWFRLWFWYWWK